MALDPVPAREAEPGRAALDGEALEAATLHFLRRRSHTRPDLRLIEWRGERAVAKDWANAWPIVRPHARRCLDREWRALAALSDLPGIPRPIARLPHAIVVSFVEGRPLQLAGLPAARRREFFDALAQRVAQIHARGVVHLDLRQRRNILCGPGLEPQVLDFEAAHVCDPARLSGRLALRWGRRVDRLAILKHKARYAPALLTPRERRAARIARIAGWIWPSAVLHRIRVALRRRRRDAGS
jgi:aminoglycoside phosphotransferase (APT) family kinase protein